MRRIGFLLVVVGLLLLADAAVTVVWQEPVTSVYARAQQSRLYAEWQQTRLDGKLDVENLRFEQVELGGGEQKLNDLALGARAFKTTTHAGEPLAQIRIEKIGLEAVVVGGASGSSLRLGPGHYPWTDLPGSGKTVALAGHRTTYLAPFRRIDQLRRGDRIVLTLSYGRFTYVHERTQIVEPDAVWVTADTGYERLVLTACHPLFSDEQRIVVFARLVRAEAAV